MDSIITVAAQDDPDKRLLAEVDAFLERTAANGMSKTRLGLETMKEGGLVDSLRGGRSLSLRNANKVLSFIRHWSPDNPSAAAPSASNGGENISSPEADSPRPFPEGSASGPRPTQQASPHKPSGPTSSSTCPSCGDAATAQRLLPCSTGEVEAA